MSLFSFFKPKTKPFSAWQIELTTKCSLRCRMCVREGFKDWHDSDMSFDNFKKIIPYFGAAEAIVLEGWGESLLHKNLIEIIGLAKAEGPEVGFVTSGRVLNRDYISELVKSGVDFIGFSLSGAAPETHNSIRVNSEFRPLIEHIRTFNEIKKDIKSSTPRLHIVYLMVRDNIYEIPYLLRLAKDIGIEEIVLINLILVTNEWQENQRVFRCATTLAPLSKGEGKGAVEDYEDILKEAVIKASELKIKLSLPSLSPIDVSVCTENPLRNLYISVDGDVSPCVYLYPPTASPFRKIFCGDEYSTDKVSFGNIFREPLYEIWNSREYTEFRDCFAKRKRKAGHSALSLLDIERMKKFETEPLPDPPGQCRTCHKMLGV